MRDLFAGNKDIVGISSLTIEHLAEVLIRGGWPASIDTDTEIAQKRAYDYVDAVINQDVSRVDDVKKDPRKMRALMRSLARNVAAEATMSTLIQDIKTEDESITAPTISKYLQALKSIFVIEDLPAWNPSLRSKTPLRKCPKRHFIDPSIAARFQHLRGSL